MVEPRFVSKNNNNIYTSHSLPGTVERCWLCFENKAVIQHHL